jgi:hypothetical protein
MELGALYEFVYRGQLADEALDRAGRTKFAHSGESEAEMAETLSLGVLDDDLVAGARYMSTVYTAVAAFENSARTLVGSTMLEGKGEKWWEECVSSRIQKKAKDRRADDEKNRFHSQRGDDPINYSDLGDLLNIIRAHPDLFEPAIPSPEWAQNIFDAVERSRNVIMHSGSLGSGDVARVGINIRDWVKQVGA